MPLASSTEGASRLASRTLKPNCSSKHICQNYPCLIMSLRRQRQWSLNNITSLAEISGPLINQFRAIDMSIRSFVQPITVVLGFICSISSFTNSSRNALASQPYILSIETTNYVACRIRFQMLIYETKLILVKHYIVDMYIILVNVGSGVNITYTEMFYNDIFEIITVSIKRCQLPINHEFEQILILLLNSSFSSASTLKRVNTRPPNSIADRILLCIFPQCRAKPTSHLQRIGCSTSCN